MLKKLKKRRVSTLLILGISFVVVLIAGNVIFVH